MDIHILFAQLAWILLIAVMIVRPANDLWGGSVWRWGMRYRQYLGIGAGVAAIIHIILFVWGKDLGFDFWLSSAWNLQTLFGWGMLALICILPPLITSTIYAKKFFRKNWKRIQQLAYLAFLFTAIHIFLVGDWGWGLGPWLIWVVLWLMANGTRHNLKNS